jgi:hypothetical protein
MTQKITSPTERKRMRLPRFVFEMIYATKNINAPVVDSLALEFNSGDSVVVRSADQSEIFLRILRA